MSYEIFSNIYLPLLFITAGISIYRWRILSQADKWMCTLLIATVLSESIQRILAEYKGNNFVIFHFYTPLELLLISLYFDRSIKFRKPYVVALIIGTIGILLSTFNAFYLQDYRKINSYILLLEACIIISFCMLSFYRLLIRDNIVPVKMAHFWLTICFLFYSSLTFVIYGLYGAIVGNNSKLATVFNLSLWFANFFLYIGIAIVFIRYKKLIPSGE